MQDNNQNNYFNAAISWETSVVASLRKSARTAWIVASIACFIAVISVAAVAGLTPLKTVEPYVIRVDSSTGIPDVITAIKDEKSNYDEVVNKYFLAQYIIHRERYLPETRKHDYKLTGLLSTQSQASKYGAWYDPKSNSQSPLKLYDSGGSAAIEIKNISFLEKDVALVRFTKIASRANESVRSYWMATVSFDYSAGTMTASDRLLNPLGFQVREYRVDPETMTEIKEKTQEAGSSADSDAQESEGE